MVVDFLTILLYTHLPHQNFVTQQIVIYYMQTKLINKMD